MHFGCTEERLKELRKVGNIDELLDVLTEKVNADREIIRVRVISICKKKLNINQAVMFGEYYMHGKSLIDLKYQYGKDSYAHIERSLRSAEKKLLEELINIYGERR